MSASSITHKSTRRSAPCFVFSYGDKTGLIQHVKINYLPTNFYPKGTQAADSAVRNSTLSLPPVELVIEENNCN